MTAQDTSTDMPSLGTLVSVNSPEMAEALSASGLDWLFFDMEHSALSFHAVQTMIAAMSGGCRSFIRLDDANELAVKHAVDTGCDGLILPQVNTADLARRMVAAASYPPAGRRSIGLSRSAGFGYGLAAAIPAGSRPALHIQIEHRDALSCLDDIAGVVGVDGLFVGPYDLSASFGKPGDVAAPEVTEAISAVLDCANRYNLVPGIFAGSNEAARRYLDMGFSFVAVGSDLMRLRASAAETVKLNSR